MIQETLLNLCPTTVWLVSFRAQLVCSSFRLVHYFTLTKLFFYTETLDKLVLVLDSKRLTLTENVATNKLSIALVHVYHSINLYNIIQFTYIIMQFVTNWWLKNIGGFLFSQISMNLPFLLAACPCNLNGGYCDEYGSCICYPGYTGQYCDETGREKARRQEGGWDAHVGTVWL